MRKAAPPSPYVASKTTSDDMMFEPTNPGKDSIESGVSYDGVGEAQTSPACDYQPDGTDGQPES